MSFTPFPQREHVPVEQMDASARPYFIHHRNQVGLNSVLMELFRWIDLFLQSDETAREPLNALRLISDYLQQQHFVAPIPSEGLVDMYDESKVQPNTTPDAPFADLARLLASVPRVGQSNTHSVEHPVPTPTPARTSGAATNVQLDALRNSAAISASGQRSSQGSFVHVTWPPKDPPKEKPRQRRNSIRFLTRKDEIKEDEGNYTDFVRNKLTLWLSRPDIRALKTRVKQALNKQSCVPKPDHVFAPQFISPATSFVGEPQSATTNLHTSTSSRRSRRPSTTDPEARPQIIRLDGVQVTKNTVTQGDATPPARRKRAQSSSAAKNLPQPPPPEVVKTSEPAPNGPSRESSKRLRRTSVTIVPTKDHEKESEISHHNTLEEASSRASPATTAPYVRPVVPLSLHSNRAGPSNLRNRQPRPDIPTTALTDFEGKHKPRRRVLAPEVPIIEATERSPAISVQRPSMAAPLASPDDIDFSELSIASPVHDSMSSPETTRRHGRKEVAIYDPPMRPRTSRGKYAPIPRSQRPTDPSSSQMTVSSSQNTTMVYRIELEDLPHFSQGSADESGLMPDFGAFPSPTYDESEARLSTLEREMILQKMGVRQGETRAPPRLALDTQNQSSAYAPGPASSSLLYSAGEYSAYPLMDYPTPNSHRSASLRSVKRKDVPAYDPRTGEMLEQREQPRASPSESRRTNIAGDYLTVDRNRRSLLSVDQVNQSRFSLDSDFSGQTHSASESSHRRRPPSQARRDSTSTLNAVSSSNEAMSQEGEWMANLASRRRPFIRSSSAQKKTSRRRGERASEMQDLPEEQQVDEEGRNPRHHATISLPVQQRPQSRELARTAIHQSWQGRGKEVYAGF